MAHILIIDDDPDILRLMQFTLTQAKHTVTVASDGPAAITAINKQKPDCIIVDIMMPQMTGYQFTREVRKMPGMGTLPILVYSARFQPIDKKTAINSGATDYMPKTVAPSEIVATVEKLLSPSSALSEGKQDHLLIGFFSLRGGVGVSALAINTAAVIGLSKKVPVVLADAHPLAGHAGLMLGIRAKQSLAVLQRKTETLTGELLANVLASHPKSGIKLLASPLVRSATPPTHSLESILRLIKAHYQYSIIDLPSDFSEEVLSILPLLDRLVLVTAPDLPSLQSTAVARKTLGKLGTPVKSVHVVLNGNTDQPTLKPASIEKALRSKLFAEIPFDASMRVAIHTGNPIALANAQSVSTTAIAQLAVNLLKEYPTA